MQTELLTVRELAQKLKVGRSTFHAHNARGLIGPKPIKIGGVVRYYANEIAEWIKAGCPCRSRWIAMQQAQDCK